MRHFEVPIEIAAPPDKVFAFVTDVNRLTEWQDGVQEAYYEGEPGVGAVMVVRATFMGQNVDTRSEITAWEPPHRWAYRSAGGAMNYTSDQTFEPTPAGTRMTVRADIEMTGIMKLAEGVLGGNMQKEYAKVEKRLNEILGG